MSPDGTDAAKTEKPEAETGRSETLETEHPEALGTGYLGYLDIDSQLDQIFADPPEQMAVLGYLTTAQLMRQAGATARQVQYWSEHGLLRPKLVAHKRWFLPEDVKAAGRLVQVSRSGLRLGLVRRLMQKRWSTVRRITRPTVVGDVLVIPWKKQRGQGKQ